MAVPVDSDSTPPKPLAKLLAKLLARRHAIGEPRMSSVFGMRKSRESHD
jgi:hypothetical protein